MTHIFTYFEKQSILLYSTDDYLEPVSSNRGQDYILERDIAQGNITHKEVMLY